MIDSGGAISRLKRSDNSDRFSDRLLSKMQSLAYKCFKITFPTARSVRMNRFSGAQKLALICNRAQTDCRNVSSDCYKGEELRDVLSVNQLSCGRVIAAGRWL